MNTAGTIMRHEVYGYDDQGRVTSVAAPEGVINYKHDPATGQLTDTWTSSLDAVNPTAQTSSTWTQYAYDALGRLQTVTAKRLLAQDRNLVTTYSYDAVGNLAAVLQPSGVLTSYTYDALNRLDLETITKDTQVLASYDYHVLADGNRDYVIETDSLGGHTRIDWTYDADGRLTSETRNEGNDTLFTGGDYIDTYTLDLVANRLIKVHDAVGTANDETTTDTYNERDQLTSEDSTNNAHDASYTYDNNGSQHTKTAGTVTTVYSWDLHNRLVSIDNTNDGTNDVTYQYDSSDVRVAESANGQTVY